MTDISREYASALFSLVESDNCEKEVYSSLLRIKRILDENPEYVKMLASPAIDKKERAALFTQAIASEPELVKDFSSLLCEKGYIVFFGEISDEYGAMYFEKSKITRVKITSATGLTSGEKAALEKKLESVTGNRIEAEYCLDPSLIAGVKAEYDGKVSDGSLKHRLREIKEVIDK